MKEGTKVRFWFFMLVFIAIDMVLYIISYEPHRDWTSFLPGSGIYFAIKSL